MPIDKILLNRVTQPSRLSVNSAHGLAVGRTPMTFDLICAGWPNTAAILALAMMPVVALATGRNRWLCGRSG